MNEEKLEAEVLTKEKPQSTWESVLELARFAILAVLIVLPVRMFIAQPFIVSGSSMFPTFHDGEYLIVDELSYRLSAPERDDVVIFRYPNDPKKFFIKRIIGLPNETVDISGSTITITNSQNKNGFVLDEPYIKEDFADNTHMELASDEYFVMGDNRNASSDSRTWGALPKNLLIGKAFVRLFPVNRVDFMPGDYK